MDHKNFNITCGRYWYGRNHLGWIEPNRRLYDNEMVWFTGGSCRVITEKGSFDCSDGTLLIIPPQLEHCTVSLTACDRWCIHFDWYGTAPAYRCGKDILPMTDHSHVFDPALAAEPYGGNDLEFPVCFKFSGEDVSTLTKLFRKFFSTPGDTPGGRLTKLGILHQILGFVMTAKCGRLQTQDAKSTFFLAKQLIDRKFTDCNLELKKIAGDLRISPNHLNKLFRQNLKTTVSSYLLNRRLLHAGELLCSTRSSVEETAYACGFSDPNYFIRCFRRKNGTPPGKFRKSVQE